MGAAGEVGGLLLDLVLILAVARLAGILFERMRQPAVVGELLAGLVLGPSLVGYVPNVFDAAAEDATRETVLLFLAELGAIVLLFQVGLESRLKDLVSVGRAAAVVAVIGIVASVAIGMGASWGFARAGVVPDSWLFHLFVGATFAATSVGITARVLRDMNQLGSREARIILGAAVLDDVGGLLVLAVVAGLAAAAAAGGSFSAMDVATTFGIAVGFLVAALVLGLKLAPPVFKRISRRGIGPVVAFGFALAVLLAALAGLAGLATIVGAFAAGIILSETKQRHDIFEGTTAIGYVFVPFFFAMVGAALDVSAVGDDWPRVLLVVGALTVAAVAAKLLCGFGVRKGEADRAIVGVGMVPRGEVGLIFVVFGVQNLGVEPWLAVALVLVVMLTTIGTPVALRSLYAGRKSAPDAGDNRAEIGEMDPD